jgi:hypothetical protein
MVRSAEGASRTMKARMLQRGPVSFETPLARLLRMRGGG